eukprot:scaffold112765_cov44-Attheya_sp.AAC.1
MLLGYGIRLSGYWWVMLSRERRVQGVIERRARPYRRSIEGFLEYERMMGGVRLGVSICWVGLIPVRLGLLYFQQKSTSSIWWPGIVDSNQLDAVVEMKWDSLSE